MEQNKRHKWADVIIAWANGETIQWRYNCAIHPDDGWKDYPTTLGGGTLFSDDRLQWRIKPKTKTVWYNLYSDYPGDMYFKKESIAIECGKSGSGYITTLSIEIPA